MTKNNKWVLVTGGSRGLGRELVCNLAKAGYNVSIHYNKSQKEAEEVAELCRKMGVAVSLYSCDFTSIESIKEFIRKWSIEHETLYAFINNVGIYLRKNIWETTTEELTELFQINVQAFVFFMQQLKAKLVQEKGHVITIGNSGLGAYKVASYAPVYMASKEALLSITRALAKELAQEGVRVNMISPGKLPTSIDLTTAPLPMHRPVDTEEVVRTVLFLLDKKNYSITGQNIEIAGGLGL